MHATLFVSTDAAGVEHTPAARIPWRLPGGAAGAVTERDGGLVLRRPVALLDVLDERVFVAEPREEVAGGPGDTLTVRRARLVSTAPWDPAVATAFALDCAEHCEHQLAGVHLPDGTPLASVIADARQVIAGSAPEAAPRLGFLARIAALRRLHRERGELADLEGAVIVDDESRGLDAYLDPDYADLLPITDAVLSAIEALRHHLEPHLLAAAEEARGAREEHRHDDLARPMATPTVLETAWGPVAFGPRVLAYEPSWVAAREAARHARLAARNHGRSAAESAERAWQGEHLEALLTPREPPAR